MKNLNISKKNKEFNQEPIDSIEKQGINLAIKRNQFIFSRENLKSFIYTTFILFGIIGAYYLIISLIMPMQDPRIEDALPEGGPPPGNLQSFPLAGFGINIWPFWGIFHLPSASELLLFAIISLGFVIAVRYFYGKNSRGFNIYMIMLFGTLLIIFTNLISGWESGIVSSIGNYGEIYDDAVQIVNPITFISEFESLQDYLTVHARTHPPGAVLTIYLFYLVFNSPGFIAIAICVCSSILSAFFLNGIFKNFFKGEIPKYMVFLYLLLPAIQVYYLANIYAIVTTLIIGVIYFYFHWNTIISIIGCIICSFLASFISFMALFFVGCLFLYEVFNLWRKGSLRRNAILSLKGIKSVFKDSQRLFFMIVGIVGIYGILLFTLGFNYINSFLIAVAAETSQGWELITNPFEYLTSRVTNIMDILMFFGPVLIVLCYKGYVSLKKDKLNSESSAKLFNLVTAAIITLLAIFILGAYDHGETARAAMFIYPFLLIPVAFYLSHYSNRVPKYEMGILLTVLFGQAIFMQLVGNFIW